MLLGARIDTGALDDTASHAGFGSPPSAKIACSRKTIFRGRIHHHEEGRGQGSERLTTTDVGAISD